MNNYYYNKRVYHIGPSPSITRKEFIRKSFNKSKGIRFYSIFGLPNISEFNRVESYFIKESKLCVRGIPLEYTHDDGEFEILDLDLYENLFRFDKKFSTQYEDLSSFTENFIDG